MNKEERERRDSIIKSFALLSALFFGYLLDNVLNFLGSIWINDGGIVLRNILSYLGFPLILMILLKEIFKKIEYKNVFIKHSLLCGILSTIIIVIACVLCSLQISYEIEKKPCRREQDVQNIKNCLKDVDNNRFNPIKFFENEKGI